MVTLPILSLRGESNDRTELDSTKQSVGVPQEAEGLLRHRSAVPRNDIEGSVREILSSVMDPEIPTLSVLDLGMITDVHASDKGVRVKLLPTFVACPATSYIKSNITNELTRAGFPNVEVDLETEMNWTSDRISEEGQKKLKAFGLGAPVQIDGVLDLERIEHVSCPHCGSANTELRSMFGSTLCRSIHFCNDCKQGFERFKPL